MKPRAFYKVQDLDAQRFIGKCLETASKRLSAKELMLDPFLAVDQIDDHSGSNLGSQKPFLNHNIKLEHLQLKDDAPRTNMTITGKLNPGDGAIILKVQIADKEGIHLSYLSGPQSLKNVARLDTIKLYSLSVFRCCEKCVLPL